MLERGPMILFCVEGTRMAEQNPELVVVVVVVVGRGGGGQKANLAEGHFKSRNREASIMRAVVLVSFE